MFSLFRKSPPSVDAAAIIAQVASGSATLIDVREPAEIASSGRADGAIAIPLSEIGRKADPASPDHDSRLRMDVPVVVYCASGARSANAKQQLERLGYADVTNLGGLRDWQAAGGAVVR